MTHLTFLLSATWLILVIGAMLTFIAKDISIRTNSSLSKELARLIGFVIGLSVTMWALTIVLNTLFPRL